MGRPKFSPKFPTWGAWKKAGNRETDYAKEIIKKHQMFPDKSLKTLNALKLSDIDISLKSWSSLNEKEIYERSKALQVAKIMRDDKRKPSLTKAIEKVNSYASTDSKINENLVKKHLGKALYKEGKKWKIRKTDTIEVKSLIFSEGKSEYITIKSSKDRALIRDYHNDIYKLEKAKTIAEKQKILKKWKGKTITDKNGKKWKLETTLEGLEYAKEPYSGYQTIYAR